jgi:nonribosomal peptide synthetase CepB
MMKSAEPYCARKKRVSEWLRLYEWIYAELEQGDGFGNNFVGWRSSYDGSEIPQHEMMDWRDATVESILELRPCNVLEIGVGTGLLASRLVGQVDQYVATDFSEAAIAGITAHLSESSALGTKVCLRTQEADDFRGLGRDCFDTVLLNSVAQYFPSRDYLRRVIEGAVGLLRPGGAMFIGDVRNLRTHRAFRVAVLAAEIEGRTGPRAARQIVDDSAAQERELLVDPDFFAEACEAIPEAEAAEVRIKRARYNNEMSAHRYDAVIYKRPSSAIPQPAGIRRLAWEDAGGLVGIARALDAERSPGLRITAIPNARIWHEITALRLLDTGHDVPEVLSALRIGCAGASAPDPESFYELGNRRSWRTVVTCSSDGAADTVDVLFHRTGLAVAFQHGPARRSLTNDPLADD